MIIPSKPKVNKILEHYEITKNDLIIGNEYLLEYNDFSGKRTIKTKGLYIKESMNIIPYIVTYFKTPRWIYPEMYHESLTRYYLPVSKKIMQKSLERQAFMQSINKLFIKINREKKIDETKENSIGNDLVKIYY
jgi:hypothetical protein